MTPANVHSESASWTPGPPAGPGVVDTLAAGAKPFKLPATYLEFLRRTNGGEGRVGHPTFGWCQLWPAEQVLELNRGYQMQEFAPGFFAIASDGGGELLALDYGRDPSRSVRLCMLPAVPMDPANAIEIASDFPDLAVLFGRQVA